MDCLEDEIAFSFRDDRICDLPMEFWESQKESEANQPISDNVSGITLNKIIWETQIYFSPYQSASIVLSLNPYHQRNEEKHDDFRILLEIFRQYTEQGLFKNSKIETEKDEILGEVKVYKIHRTDILLYRNNYLKIPLTLEEPPNFEEALQIQPEKKITKDEEIARLKAEIESLKQVKTEQAQQPQAVNYEKNSLYGHTSENLEIVFKLSKLITEKCDVDNPHSYPSKDDIAMYVKKYHSDSSKLAEAIYQIITPEKVKNRGRTPKGVDTFEGF